MLWVVRRGDVTIRKTKYIVFFGLNPKLTVEPDLETSQQKLSSFSSNPSIRVQGLG